MSLLKIEAYHEISKSEKLYKDIFKRILKYTDEFLSNHHPPHYYYGRSTLKYKIFIHLINIFYIFDITLKWYFFWYHYY